MKGGSAAVVRSSFTGGWRERETGSYGLKGKVKEAQ